MAVPMHSLYPRVPHSDAKANSEARAAKELLPKLKLVRDTAERAIDAAKTKLHALPAQAAALAGQVKEFGEQSAQDAAVAASEWKQAAKQKLADSGRRLRTWAGNREPLYLASAAALTGFIAGVALRLWRMKHARS